MHNISIVMATYNGAKFVKEQLDSIKEQKQKPYEIIVVDDCSTDNTVEIIKRWAETSSISCSIHVNDKNMGACKSFEKGLLLTTGDYIAFCDQDDVWEKDKLSISLNKIKDIEQNNSSIPALVYTDMRVVDEKLNSLNQSFLAYEGMKNIDAKDKYKVIMLHNYITGCALLMNKKAKEECIPFSNKAIMHDWWIALVISVIGKIGFINKPMVKYRQHGNNVYGAHSYFSIQGMLGLFNFNKRIIRIREIIAQLQGFKLFMKKKYGTESNRYIEIDKITSMLENGEVYKLWKNGVCQQGKIRTCCFYLLLYFFSIIKKRAV